MQKSDNTNKKYLSKAATAAAGLVLTAPAWATTTPVPEPNTLFLIGAGVVSAILIARYKTKK